MLGLLLWATLARACRPSACADDDAAHDAEADAARIDEEIERWVAGASASALAEKGVGAETLAGWPLVVFGAEGVGGDVGRSGPGELGWKGEVGETRSAASAGPTVEDGCAICFADYEVGDHLRLLPCRHPFHSSCVDPYLLCHSTRCPLCRLDLAASTSPEPAAKPPVPSDAPFSRFEHAR